MANTKELIDSTFEALRGEVTKKQIETITTTFLGLAAEALNEGGEVTFRNFGRFYNHERAARIGRNPKTGESISIPAKSVVKFKGRDMLSGSEVTA